MTARITGTADATASMIAKSCRESCRSGRVMSAAETCSVATCRCSEPLHTRGTAQRSCRRSVTALPWPCKQRVDLSHQTADSGRQHNSSPRATAACGEALNMRSEGSRTVDSPRHRGPAAGSLASTGCPAALSASTALRPSAQGTKRCRQQRRRCYRRRRRGQSGPEPALQGPWCAMHYAHKCARCIDVCPMP